MKPSGADVSRKKTRASTPRVKTGCGNCRKRHIKCDETKPFCNRCVRAGWKCDGYPSHVGPGKDLDKPVVSQVARVSASPPLSISSYSLPFRIPGSQKDRQVLHYFCAQGSSDISGFLSSKFWSHTILQNSYHEPVVRQALVALSSLHLDFATSDTPATQLSVEPLLQHGKALRMLNRRLSGGGSEAMKAALLCCVLFFCFESTAGNSAAALQHLSKGLGILATGIINRKNVDDLDSIYNVFVRLDLQATMFDDDRPPFLVLVSPEERQAGIMGDPAIPFTTLEEAQMMLDRLQNWLFHLIIGGSQYQNVPVKALPPDILRERELLVLEYDRWAQKFSLQAKNPGEGENLCGVKTLLLHHRISQMLLASRIPNDDTIFSISPNPAAEEILDHAESILDHLRERHATAKTAKNPRRSLASDTGIIVPLSMLAIKCADEFVRKRAIELLARSQRQEGLYDAMTVVTIVQGLDEVRKQRLLAAELEGVEDQTPKSLEYWTTDIINGAPSDLVAREPLAPKTILHTSTLSPDTSFI